MKGDRIPPPSLPTWFEAPEHPPAQDRIAVNITAGAARLGFAIIRSGGWHAIAGATLLALFNTCTMLMPVILGGAIDSGIAPVLTGIAWQDAVSGFLLWSAAIAGLYAMINITFRFGGRLGWYAMQRAQFELSDRVLARVLDRRGIDGPQRLPGNLLAVATLDAHRACSAMYVAIYPLGELIAVVVAAVSLFAIHPLLGIGVTVGAFLLLGLMTVVARPLLDRGITEQERAADATAVAADLVSGYRVLAGIHAQGPATARYRQISRVALRGTLAARTAEGGFEGVTTALTGLFAAAVAVGAAGLAFAGQISIGGLIAAAGIAQVLLTPLQLLIGEAGSTWAFAMASARRVLDLLSSPERGDRQGTDTPPTSGAPGLTIEPIRSDDGAIGLHVASGEFVVLDLPSADQTAVVDALTLNRTPGATKTLSASRVLLHGAPLTGLDPAALRARVLVAPHRAELFHGSIINNVSLSDATPAARLRARRALSDARCESLEDELPDGYDTAVGEGGNALSGGQRQRVALARAIATDAPVLVLHEPTTAVDSATVVEIAQRVKASRHGRTTVVLTSAPAFRAVADRVIVGTVHESPGTSDHEDGML